MTIPTGRDGPTLRVVVDCGKCQHLRSEYYCIEDGNDVDSGFNHTCMHPDGKGAMGEATPAWCPLLADARAALGRELVAAAQPSPLDLVSPDEAAIHRAMGSTPIIDADALFGQELRVYPKPNGEEPAR